MRFDRGESGLREFGLRCLSGVDSLSSCLLARAQQVHHLLVDLDLFGDICREIGPRLEQSDVGLPQLCKSGSTELEGELERLVLALEDLASFYYQFVQSLVNWGMGGAAAFVLLVVTLALYALQLRFFNPNRSR